MLSAKKQDTLDALDKLLGDQNGRRSEKIAALREVAAAASRMAEGCEKREQIEIRLVCPAEPAPAKA